jgi:hypothetical protein
MRKRCTEKKNQGTIHLQRNINIMESTTLVKVKKQIVDKGTLPYAIRDEKISVTNDKILSIVIKINILVINKVTPVRKHRYSNRGRTPSVTTHITRSKINTPMFSRGKTPMGKHPWPQPMRPLGAVY